MTPPSPETLILIAVLAPFIGALIIPLFHSRPNLRETVTLVTAGVLCVTVFALLGPVLGGARPEVRIIEVIPGIALAFQVEPLGMLFALVASSLWIVNSIYSIGYMRANKEPRQTGFYVCFAIALGSTIGIAFAKNLFTLFLFYEALTISTYPLVTHKPNDEADARRAALSPAPARHVARAVPAGDRRDLCARGHARFHARRHPRRQGGRAGDRRAARAVRVRHRQGGGDAAAFLAARRDGRADAGQRAAARRRGREGGRLRDPESRRLIFGIETLSATGQSTWLTIVAGTTVIVASLVALRQDNLKRRLAYSTVSQLSYVVLGVAILAPISVLGAAMHIAAHAVSKITLFFAAGSIYTAAHLTEVSQLDGIGRRMPWTMGAFTIGALGMIGIPPTAGFLGKWFMLSGAMQTANWIALGVIIVSTILNAGYFLPIVFRAFFREPARGHAMRTARRRGRSCWRSP